jgi:hypothetical protein
MVDILSLLERIIKMEKRFLYEIRPVRPVNINGRITRVPTSINLTKAEVKQYMAYGAVYRRFGATDLVKVTGANLDSLHVSKEDAAENKVIDVARHGEVNLKTNTPGKERYRYTKVEGEEGIREEKVIEPAEEAVEPVAEEVSSDNVEDDYVDDGKDKKEEEDTVDNSEDTEESTESTDSTSEDEINDAENIDSEADNDTVDAEMENSEDSAVNTEEPAEEKHTTAVIGYHANNNQKFNKKHRHNR